MVFKVVVESGQENGPAGLTTVEVLLLHKVLEGSMIGEYVNWFRGTFQLSSPFLQTSDYCQHFLVVNFIIAFCRGVFLGVEGNGVQNACGAVLREDTG